MLDVITIGTVTRDVFLKSRFFRVLRDPRHLQSLGFPTGEAECFALGAKLEIGRPVVAGGGGATNAAVTFARQGLRTAVLAKIGQDEFGAAILKNLKKEKISSFLAIDNKDGTGYSTILVNEEGERTILHYRGASQDLTLADVPFSKLKAKWAYIAPGNISFSLMTRLVGKLKKNKTKIAINPSKSYLSLGAKKLKSILAAADIVILNREEASYLTGVDYKNNWEIFRVLDEIIGGLAVMTDGPRGAVASDGEYFYRVGVFPEKKLVDRTGAGDAFGSGLTAALARGRSLEEALRVAAANATSVVEFFGAETGILRLRDLQNKRWQNCPVSREEINLI